MNQNDYSGQMENELSLNLELKSIYSFQIWRGFGLVSFLA